MVTLTTPIPFYLMIHHFHDAAGLYGPLLLAAQAAGFTLDRDTHKPMLRGPNGKRLILRPEFRADGHQVVHFTHWGNPTPLTTVDLTALQARIKAVRLAPQYHEINTDLIEQAKRLARRHFTS